MPRIISGLKSLSEMLQGCEVLNCPSFVTACPDEYREGVNGYEFKTPGKRHILRVSDAKPTTPSRQTDRDWLLPLS